MWIILVENNKTCRIFDTHGQITVCVHIEIDLKWADHTDICYPTLHKCLKFKTGLVIYKFVYFQYQNILMRDKFGSLHWYSSSPILISADGWINKDGFRILYLLKSYTNIYTYYTGWVYKFTMNYLYMD